MRIRKEEDHAKKQAERERKSRPRPKVGGKGMQQLWHVPVVAANSNIVCAVLALLQRRAIRGDSVNAIKQYYRSEYYEDDDDEGAATAAGHVCAVDVVVVVVVAAADMVQFVGWLLLSARRRDGRLYRG